MRRLAFAALAGGFLAAPAAADDVLRVTIDQAKVAKLPSGVVSLLLGNPGVADVTLLKNGITMVVTGKSYGQTNLIALDATGRQIDQKQIRVDPPTHVLVVQRGDARESFSCDPVCMPSAVLGDETKHFSDVTGQVGAHDQFAAPKSAGPVVRSGS